MNDPILVALVRKVRSLQKEYFRTRDREVLIQSKVAEKELDHLLATLPPDRQGDGA